MNCTNSCAGCLQGASSLYSRPAGYVGTGFAGCSAWMWFLMCACLMQVEAVVRRVLWLIRDPQTKVLVFSTWVEVLQLLEHALNTNHVPCVRAKSRKALEQAIEDFRKPVQSGKPHLQTMLLQLKQGGNGLNLTGASLTSMLQTPTMCLACTQSLRRPWSRPSRTFAR